jgi:hypothetical protein
MFTSLMPPLFAVLVLLTLVACQDRHVGSDYLPLSFGSQWQYRIERTTMDGVRQLRDLIEVSPPAPDQAADLRSRATLGGQRFTYKLTAEGIYRVGVQRTRGPQTLTDTQQQLVMPAKLAIDQQWQGHSLTTVLESSAPPWESLFRVQVPVTMHYRVARLDAEVSTPAGAFDHCLLISGHGSAAADFGNGIGAAKVEVTSHEWYAPGVGLVRMERHERSDAKALRAGALVMELDHWSRH